MENVFREITEVKTWFKRGKYIYAKRTIDGAILEGHVYKQRKDNEFLCPETDSNGRDGTMADIGLDHRIATRGEEADYDREHEYDMAWMNNFSVHINGDSQKFIKYIHACVALDIPFDRRWNSTANFLWYGVKNGKPFAKDISFGDAIFGSPDGLYTEYTAANKNKSKSKNNEIHREIKDHRVLQGAKRSKFRNGRGRDSTTSRRFRMQTKRITANKGVRRLEERKGF